MAHRPTAHRPTRPRHRAFIAAVAVVAVGFLAGAAVAFSGGGDQATEQTPKPEASLGTISPTTAVSPSSRATTTAPPVAAVGSPPAPVAPGTIETVPTTAAPPTTTPETTPTTG